MTSSTMPTVKCRFGSGLRQLVEDRDGHGRRELLGGQAVPPADDPGERRTAVAVRRPALDQGGDDVLVERLAEGARLLGAVEDGDAPDGRRQGGEEGRGVEGAVEPDLDQADLLAPRDQRLDRLLDGPRARAHHDDRRARRPGRRRSRTGGTAGPTRPAKRSIVRWTMPGQREVERVRRLAGLEEDVRVLRRAAEDRAVRARAPARGGPGPAPRRSSPGCRPARAARSC